MPEQFHDACSAPVHQHRRDYYDQRMPFVILMEIEDLRKLLSSATDTLEYHTGDHSFDSGCCYSDDCANQTNEASSHKEISPPKDIAETSRERECYCRTNCVSCQHPVVLIRWA